MRSILILFHCESNTGYAIGRLEAVFYTMAMQLCDNDSRRIHFAYPSMHNGPSPSLPAAFSQYLVLDSETRSPEEHLKAEQYIRDNCIDTLFGFDQPVRLPIYKSFRRAGIRNFISYWGAPISSIFNPFKRILKKIEVSMYQHGPDHYIFESQGMADTAVLGRGIPEKKVSVVYLGVSIEEFHPDKTDAGYAYELFGIPPQRKIFFYSGHMEPRKGISVIMEAANMLAQSRAIDDWQILLFGNKGGQERPYINQLSDKARTRVIFGGYRDDINRIHRSCYAAIIASTGWDSFTRSSVEVQASGLPLIVSDLPGLNEAVEHNTSGFIFKNGDSTALAKYMVDLLHHPELRESLSQNAEARINRRFTTKRQIDNLIATVKKAPILN